MTYLLFLLHGWPFAAVDCNGSIGANNGADATAGAGFWFYHHRRMITSGAKALNIQCQNPKWAVCNAELTGFTILFVDFYPSLSGHADPPFVEID
jgi:hypothetical protein